MPGSPDPAKDPAASPRARAATKMAKNGWGVRLRVGRTLPAPPDQTDPLPPAGESGPRFPRKRTNAAVARERAC